MMPILPQGLSELNGASLGIRGRRRCRVGSVTPFYLEGPIGALGKLSTFAKNLYASGTPSGSWR